MTRRSIWIVAWLLAAPLAASALGQAPGRAVEEPPLDLGKPAAKSGGKPTPKPPAPRPAPRRDDPAPLPIETPVDDDSKDSTTEGDDTGSPFDAPDTVTSPLKDDGLFNLADEPRAQAKKTPALHPVDPGDAEVERAQTPNRPSSSLDGNPLGPAKEPPVGMNLGTAGLSNSDPFILPPERIPTGPSQTSMAVEVRAPEVSNLHVENLFYVRIKNTGSSDALGVTVRYPLPDNLEFLDAEPSPARNDGRVYYWQLNSMPAGSERTIKVKVRPTAKGSFDHAVTVSVMAGGRARTMVRQPELKVELRPDKTKPLKGAPVIYDINVTNIGDHPARDVEVAAKLTPGLTHPKGSELALKLKQEMGIAAIEPGQSVPLKLEVDTTGMGVQTADVTVSSPDVPTAVSARAEVEVVAPDLKVAVDGPTERYPDNVASYKLTVTNAGTAPARSVVVAAQVPTAGRPESVAPKGKWVAEARTFYWSIPELPPGSSEVFNIQVRMGAIGLFSLRTGAKAQGVQPVNRTHNTDIKGVSKLAMSVTEPRGVLDEGEESSYEIRVRNEGSKEAERIQIKGVVAENLQVLSVTDAGPRGGNLQTPDPQTALFQQIDRLPPGSEVTMSFRVRAVRAGNGTCDVTLLHDDIPVPIRQTMVTKVMPANGAAAR
jgi:uncharacterized repeat protein (TIGR01451 family)